MAAKKSAPLFKSAKDLQNFIIWARSQGVLKLQVGEVQVEFAHASLPDVATSATLAALQAQIPQEQDTRTPEQRAIDQKKADDELLFWSTQ
jgi:hypothetical protein